MTTRNYSSRSQQTTLTSAVTAGSSSMVVVSGAALLGGQSIPGGTTFTIVLDPDTAIEEIVDATAVSGNTFTVTRAIDGSSAQAHSAGAVVRHMAIGRDYREANQHIEAITAVHGLGVSSAVVGTTDTQTLTNKTLTAPTITNPNISGAGVDASIVFEGATADNFETTLTVVDPTQDNTVTIPNTTGTVVIATAVQTLTNKTLTSPTISGSPIITGLSSAGMSASSATPKDYVDSILGSATSAATSATSAATSAASAATSAGSSEVSAIASASSATASATSATAAATSATSAAASATAAATSATSAAASATTAAASVATIVASATAAATSASSAATSASSASTSASSALTSANSAATSASTMSASVTAAATSAASAATSATAAATSAASADVAVGLANIYASSALSGANSAATSATSAAASATAAATSATSASASATAAATSASSASTSASSALTSQSAAATSAASASTSASSALTSATSAATSYDEFDDRYLGAKATPPTLDNDGNALLTGALYWNTSSNKMFVWSGTAWAEISSSADIISYKYTVAGGATSVSGADDNGLTLAYTVGKEQVYINGVLQVRGSDYTATTGSSITGMAALTVNDIVTILAFTAFVVANTYTQAEADARFTQQSTNLFAGKNKIINGAFDVWQRGTSITQTGNQYTADRWRISAPGGVPTLRTITQQTFSPDELKANGFGDAKFYFRSTLTTTGAATSAILGHRVEDVRTLAGQTATFSFWAKSDSTRTQGFKMLQIFGSGGSANVEFGNTTYQTTTSWQRFTFTFSVPSIAGKTIGDGSWIGPDLSQAFADGSVFDLWGVQLEAGSLASPFQTATGTIQGELAACQRYYWRQTANQNYSMFAQGSADSSTLNRLLIQFPVTMRAVPTALDYSNLANYDGVTVIAVTLAVFGSQTQSVNTSDIAATSSGLTQYRPYKLMANNSTSAFIGFSAEL